jgi:hypothetical protein
MLKMKKETKNDFYIFYNNFYWTNIKFLMKFFVILLITIFINCQDLLLVVGDVKESSVRILYENIKLKNQKITALLKNNGNTIQKYEILLENKPKILKIKDLKREETYSVEFTEKEKVTFKTLGSYKKRFLTISCNNYFKDNDDGFISKIVENEIDKYHGIIHMGDQIYGDYVFKNYNKNKTYEILLEEYRNIYRKNWNNRHFSQLLRNGANYMISDDHDIINNFDKEFLLKDENIVFLAGKQVYYEYQYSLHHDIDENIFKDKNFFKKIYYFRKMGNIGMMLLDTRFEKSFNFDQKNKLFGTKQLEEIKKYLKDWYFSVDHILIFTGFFIF